MVYDGEMVDNACLDSSITRLGPNFCEISQDGRGFRSQRIKKDVLRLFSGPCIRDRIDWTSDVAFTAVEPSEPR